MLNAAILTLSVLLAALAMGGGAPTTKPAFDLRRRNSIGSVCMVATLQLTNVNVVMDQQIAAFKSATEASIQQPTMIASRYFPKVGEKSEMFVWWIEDEPSLREVTVRNPETGQVITIPIPKERLDDARSNGECDGFFYGWVYWLPPGFVGGVTQALEVSAPGQKVPAICYPSLPLQPENAAPTTKP
jgi:hypothetical protein